MDEKTKQLQRQLAASDCEVRLAAVRQMLSLPRFSPALFFRALGDENWRVRKAAVEIFSQLQISETLVPELIKQLHHHENAGLRNAAIEILIGLGSRVVPDLQRELSCQDVEVRKFIVDILGEIGDPACSDELIAALGDPDINVRYAIVETLGKLKVSAAVLPLLNLMDNPDPGLKFTILQALTRIGKDVPTAKLVPYLGDRLLRKALFDCFGRVGGQEVLPCLVEGLLDPMRPVREAAVQALFVLAVDKQDLAAALTAETDSTQIAEYLETLLSQESSYLREAALFLYGFVARKRDLRGLLACLAEENLRSQVLATFAELGEDAYAQLVTSQGQSDPETRLYLLFVGAELGFATALPLALGEYQNPDLAFRFAAVRALGVLGTVAQLELLLPLLDDDAPEIRDAAVDAVAAMGGQQSAAVLEKIAPLLHDQDMEKRKRVIRIMGRIDAVAIEGYLLQGLKDSSSLVRCEAVKSLQGSQGDAVVSGLTLALTDESAKVRRLAVSALGCCPQNTVLQALKLASSDPDIWVRAEVMRTLGLFPCDAVGDILLQGIDDPVGLVAIAALETAVKVWPQNQQKLLKRALIHQDSEVIKVALRLLACADDPEWATACVASLLDHSQADVRTEAAQALGCCGSDLAVNILQQRLVNETEEVVVQALQQAIEHSSRLAGRDD